MRQRDRVARVAAGVVAGLAIAAVLFVLVRGPAAGPVSPGATTPVSAAFPSSQPTGTSGAPSAPPSTTGPGSPHPDPTPDPPATPAPETVVLVGAGDIADCGSDLDTETAALLDGIAGTVFTLGDNVYEDGTAAEFDACYHPTWGRHRDRTRPAPGNHDYNTAGASGYFGYFGDRAGPDRRGYYAYDAGAWRVYSLNSMCDDIGGCDAGSNQLQWLRDDLAANLRRCSLAYWHHPRYSSGDHGSQAFMDPIWDVLHGAGVELVLAGHDHLYERFAPMNEAGDLAPERGITSFVVGTGGRRFYEFDDILPSSRARVTGVAGVLSLTLTPEGWSSRFVPVAGEIFTDQAQGACH